MTLADGRWPASTVFGILFAGETQSQIGTDRHTLSEDGSTLSVKVSGFGNLLDGLKFNRIAVAIAGERALEFSLAGAAPEMQAFRNCGVELTS